MKKFLASFLSFALVITTLFALTTISVSAESNAKMLYGDFTATLVDDTEVASGNGNHTIRRYSGYTVTNVSQSNGELSMHFENGNYIRFANTFDVSTSGAKYMVVRMKGTNSWGDGLTGNALSFWFGSWGSVGADINMNVTQLTADYSDVLLEIPDGYFSSLSSHDLFIVSRRGASFDITIDEIYFCNKYPVEEPSEEQGETGSTVINKVLYNDFNSGLSEGEGNATPTGNGSNTAYVLANDGTTYSCSNGALNVKLTNGNYLRIQNTMTDIGNSKYMVVRMKGTYDWAVLEGNSIAFWFGSYGTPGARLYVPATSLTEDYSDVIFEIPSSYFNSIGADYKACLFITTERGANFDITIDEIYFCDGFEENEQIAGDANGDKVVNILDIIAMKKAIVNKKYIASCDFDKDKDLDANDLAELVKLILSK